ncbi:MAG: alcohol dehydrogenase [Deltaproteobacteria bacterium]|nr:MAG: alcohol dehydrogenase [Deltaproteobacteria bacterium]
MFMPSYYEFGCRVNIVAGHMALDEIPEILAGLSASRPMIITDKGVVGAGLVDVVINAVSEAVSIVCVEDDVPPDSDLEVVNRIAAVYKKKGCDAIIAVGGGSVMDTAKGVNIIVSENASDLMQFTGAGTLKRRLKTLIAVPTTSGTGSEVTLVAVISDPEKMRKMLFTSFFLLPDAAILDTRMTLSLPPALTAMTGMDALSHAMEAYTCLSKNPLSDSHAQAAIALIKAHLVSVVKNPDDRDGRLALATAATLAGIAFSNSMVGIVHTIGHSVGGVCHVPHGQCMAILLPYGLEYNLHKNGDATAELLLPLEGDAVYTATPADQRALAVIESIRRLNADLHDATGGRHARCLREITGPDGQQLVTRDHLPEIATIALGDGSIFYNPEEMGVDDAMTLLEAAWEGVPLDRRRIKQGPKQTWVAGLQQRFRRRR